MECSIDIQISYLLVIYLCAFVLEYDYGIIAIAVPN